jgi:L-iditol 2-dehydrogenase
VLCIGAPEHRLEATLHAGACGTLNFEEHRIDQRISWVLEQTQGRGADVTIEATGAPEAVVEAMRYTRDAGRVVIVGQYTDHGPVPMETAFNPHLDLNKKQLDIRGCWGSDFSHFFRSVAVVSDPLRSAPWEAIQLSRYKLSETNTALADVAAGRVMKALVEPTV